MKLNNKKRKIASLLIIVVLVIIIVVAAVLLMLYNKVANTIVSINVSSYPDKTEYLIGEEFDPKGISVQVIKANGEYYFVGVDELTFSGFSSQQENDNLIIKVQYNGCLAEFHVEVKKLPTPPPTLVSISIENLSKTTYTIGDWNAYNIDLMGSYFLCKYSDGSESRIGLEYHNIVNWEPVNAPCVFPLEFEYLERGVLKRVTVNITITG